MEQGNNAPSDVRRIGNQRLYPSLRDSNYLILRKRRQHFTQWVSRINGAKLRVLDVGGRIQPYRPLLQGCDEMYIAVDLAITPLVDVRADACQLPFPNDAFDLVFCTQLLEYLPDPELAVKEIHRVLKPGGICLASVAAFFPSIGDDECWRLFPRGIRHLLRDFQTTEIMDEGSSISGFLRACNACADIFVRFEWARALLHLSVVPLINLLAIALEALACTNNNQATGNFSVFAQK